MTNPIQNKKTISPFQIKNIRLFIAFRVFFNSRFYYPVFTILFIDFGLSVAQFAVLNAIWAATIVGAEVPSGALADLIGRKNLLVAAGFMMVAEIAIICFAPQANAYPWFTPDILFIVFAVNRILSGLAEAAASGADEALAYDALKAHGNKHDWGKVLDIEMRLKAGGAIIAMITGALVYDPALIKKITDFVGLDFNITQNLTMRFPLILTLATAVLTLFITISMEDPDTQKRKLKKPSVKQTLKITLKAGKWILNTPFALAVITAGLIFDGIIRMFVTLASQYYRLIDLPEASFGIIGALVASIGLVIPKVSLKMSKICSPFQIALIITITAFTGLYGMQLFIPVYGIVFAVILFSIMSMTGFFISFYLNQIADSDKRATVLSFKGLAFNLSYGLLGILYSLLLARIRGKITVSNLNISDKNLENSVFIESFGYFPWVFLLLM